MSPSPTASTDIRLRAVTLHYIPVGMRMPLKFGAQVVDAGVLRAGARAGGGSRRDAAPKGWGETPLSVAWVWPSALTWEERETRMQDFCERAGAGTGGL